MQWMLLMDTCGVEGGVAVAEMRHGAAQLVAHRALPGRETQERLMTALGEVLEEAGLMAAQLDCVAVVNGPGSFTGVRIGLAAAKGLAEALGKPMVALSRLAVLAGDTGDVVAWIDAGRGDVFAGRYRSGEMVEEVMLHGSDAVAALQPGEQPVVMEERLHGLAAEARLVPAVGVCEALPLAARAAAAGAFADAATLDANYLRVPDAELALRQRLAAA